MNSTTPDSFSYVPSRERRDCCVKALSVVSGRSYEEVHGVLAAHGRRRNRGFYLFTHAHSVAKDLGIALKLVRRSGTLGKLLRDHPQGTFLVRVSKHAFAVKDGVIYDGWQQSELRRIQHAWEVSQVPTSNPA